MTENRDVYFDGSFSDTKGSYPIMLKFEMDDNYFPGVCYYHNINYGTKLKMSVRFTEEEMIIRGKALSLIHISEPTRQLMLSRMPSSA